MFEKSGVAMLVWLKCEVVVVRKGGCGVGEVGLCWGGNQLLSITPVTISPTTTKDPTRDCGGSIFFNVRL